MPFDFIRKKPGRSGSRDCAAQCWKQLEICQIPKNTAEPIGKALPSDPRPDVLTSFSLNSMSQKTRKAIAKRFKVTGTGKVRRWKANHRHLLRNKTQKQKRAMRQDHSLGEGQANQMLDGMPHRR